MFTASHNPARYNGIKLCRAGAEPVGQDTGLAEIRDAASRRDGVPGVRRPGRDRLGHATCSREYAAYLRSARRPVAASGRSRSSSTRATAWAATPCRPCFDGLPLDRRPALLRARRHVPQPRGQPDRPGEPASTCRRRCSSDGADIGLAFDGDADRCFVVDERGEPVSPVGDHRADRGARAGREPGRHDHPQPDHLAARSRRSSRARRQPGAHPGRPLVHQGRDGRDRRGVRRRALGALLLPGLLARRLRHARRAARAGRARRARRRAPLSSLLAAVRPLRRSPARSTRRWPTRRGSTRGRARRTPAATASTVDHLDGLTVDRRRLVVQPAARPTPSRCCGSTSRRRPTPTMARSATRCSPSSAAGSLRRVMEPSSPPLLLEILACPCRTTPRSSPTTTAASRCLHLRAGRPIPVRDDIPVMLLDEATPGPAGDRRPRGARARMTCSSTRPARRPRRPGRAPTAAACCCALAVAGAQVREAATLAARGRTWPAVAEDGRPRAVVVAGARRLRPWSATCSPRWPARLPGARSAVRTEHAARLGRPARPGGRGVAVRAGRGRSRSRPRRPAAAAGCSPSARAGSPLADVRARPRGVHVLPVAALPLLAVEPVGAGGAGAAGGRTRWAWSTSPQDASPSAADALDDVAERVPAVVRVVRQPGQGPGAGPGRIDPAGARRRRRSPAWPPYRRPASSPQRPAPGRRRRRSPDAAAPWSRPSTGRSAPAAPTTSSPTRRRPAAGPGCGCCCCATTSEHRDDAAGRPTSCATPRTAGGVRVTELRGRRASTPLARLAGLVALHRLRLGLPGARPGLDPHDRRRTSRTSRRSGDRADEHHRRHQGDRRGARREPRHRGHQVRGVPRHAARRRCSPRPIHSLADSGNQVLLLVGGRRAQRAADRRSTRSATAASATSTRSSSRSCCSASAACSRSTRAATSSSTRSRSTRGSGCRSACCSSRSCWSRSRSARP